MEKKSEGREILTSRTEGGKILHRLALARLWWFSFCLISFKGLGKSIGVGGPEKRRGGSSVFEPLVGDGSFNFQLPMGVGHRISER